MVETVRISFMLTSERGVRFDERPTPEPDMTLHPAAMDLPDVRGDTVFLVVEVADVGLACDMKTTAPLYARFGVRGHG